MSDLALEWVRLGQLGRFNVSFMYILMNIKLLNNCRFVQFGTSLAQLEELEADQIEIPH